MNTTTNDFLDMVREVRGALANAEAQHDAGQS